MDGSCWSHAAPSSRMIAPLYAIENRGRRCHEGPAAVGHRRWSVRARFVIDLTADWGSEAAEIARYARLSGLVFEGEAQVRETRMAENRKRSARCHGDDPSRDPAGTGIHLASTSRRAPRCFTKHLCAGKERSEGRAGGSEGTRGRERDARRGSIDAHMGRETRGRGDPRCFTKTSVRVGESNRRPSITFPLHGAALRPASKSRLAPAARWMIATFSIRCQSVRGAG